MSEPTPYQILEALLPHLRVAAAYACEIQSRIAAQPEKDIADNFFASALTDADLSIQTFVEVALLGLFPQISFFGEEHEKTYNTKYFRSTQLGEYGDLLITLDPIDGTRFYLDGHPNFQIILTVLSPDDYEAVLAISPAENRYYYALRGQGAFQGKLHQTLEDCQPLHPGEPSSSIFLGFGMDALSSYIPDEYAVISIRHDYSKDALVPNVNGLLDGKLCGVILNQGNLIDGAALAFIAREMGYVVTALDGSPLPPPRLATGNRLPGMMIGASQKVHQDLLEAVAVMKV